jgi:hypothetical protein
MTQHSDAMYAMHAVKKIILTEPFELLILKEVSSSVVSVSPCWPMGAFGAFLSA